MIKELLLQYAPYVVIGLNALLTMLTYKRTGKVVGLSKDNLVNTIVQKDIVKEDIQGLIEYHKTQLQNLEDYQRKGGE